MNKNYFVFNGRQYYIGTIVKIYENQTKNFKFNLMLTFNGYKAEEDLYCFASLYNVLEVFKIKKSDFNLYFEKIVEERTKLIPETKTINPKYIDGIVSAWIWYIFLMFFALFLNGIGNKIIAWIVISIVFWSWRNKKMKGE